MKIMKFIVSSTDLLQGLLSVSRVIASKNPLPILDNFLFVLEGNSLTVTASDSETTLKTVINIDEVTEGGEIAVPAKLLTDTLKELPTQPIEFSTEPEKNIVNIAWASGSAQIPYLSTEDYPELPQLSEAVTLNFKGGILADGINNTIYATADEELRPVMNGIFFDLDPENPTLVASDLHRLICYSCKGLEIPVKSSFILHKKPANILKAGIDKQCEEVVVKFDESMAEFNYGHTTMICRLVVGKFPDYRKVIPQNNSNILKIDRLQLLNTVRRVAVCANKASNHIKFELNAGQIEITAKDLGFALAAYEKLSCEYNGEPLSIGFKSSFVIDILNNMACDSLIIKFASARKAALIVPADEEEESEKICGILMPIMVS